MLVAVGMSVSNASVLSRGLSGGSSSDARELTLDTAGCREDEPGPIVEAIGDCLDGAIGGASGCGGIGTASGAGGYRVIAAKRQDAS